MTEARNVNCERSDICPGVPTYRKYTKGIDEAAAYYGIGTKKLRQIIADHPVGDFYLEIGRHILIKRRQFEEFLDNPLYKFTCVYASLVT